MNPVGPTPNHRTAVIVVHGIGKPPPGETIDAFVAGLRSASPDLNPSGVAEVHPLPDYDRKDGQHHTFPCHVRTAAHAQKGSFTFAEVWWGAQQRQTSGLVATINLVANAFGLVVGLGTVLRVGTRTDAKLPHRVTRSLAHLTSAALTGPVFACNLAALLLTVVYYLLSHTRFANASHAGTLVASVACVVVALVGLRRMSGPRGDLGARIRRLHMPTDRRIDLRWLLLWLLLIGLGAIIAVSVTAHLEWKGYANCLLNGLKVALALAQTAMALTLVAHLLTAPFDRDRRVSTLAVTTCALQFGLWTWLITGVWPALLAALAPKFTVDRTLFPMRSTLVLLTLIVLLAAFAVLLARLRRPGLRLIVATAPAIALQTATSAGAVGVFAATMGWSGLADLEGFLDGYGFQHLAGLAIVVLALSPSSARVALSLADDVLTYLAKYGVTSALRQAGQVSWNRGDLRKTRAINSRFRRVAEFLHANGPWDRVVVIAHSQGTIVAVDELTAVGPGGTESSFRRGTFGADTERAYAELFGSTPTTLVTMGSPLGHIYQHYFAHLYPEGTDEHWQPLRARLAAWHNIHRTDDFVGTTIPRFDPTREFPEDHDVGLGGHTGYWTDVKALKIVRKVLGI